MPNRRLQNWLQTYAEHTAISEAPKTFHFWTGVSVIAGALRRRVWIDQKIFQWTPNFYIVLVGPPGVVQKSTTMKIGYRLLKQVPGVNFGPQSMTWQGLLKAFAASTEGFKTDQKDKDEVLAERTYMSCLTCDVSELGTFLKPRDVEMQDFLTDMWDGQIGSWSRVLATKGDEKIENPWLNIMGCTTPSWIQGNFDPSMIFGGLTSRCIFVFGSQKVNLIAYPSDLIQNDVYTQREKDLIHDLTLISKMFGPMALTKEAKLWGREWYAQHWESRPAHLASERFSGYLARKQTHIHKLAMVLTAATGDELMISKEALELADLTVTSMERDMIIVFDSISDSDSTKHIDEILAIVRRNKTVDRRTLWRHCIRLMDEQEFTNAINAAVNAGYITAQNIKGSIKISVKKDS